LGILYQQQHRLSPQPSKQGITEEEGEEFEESEELLVNDRESSIKPSRSLQQVPLLRNQSLRIGKPNKKFR